MEIKVQSICLYNNGKIYNFLSKQPNDLLLKEENGKILIISNIDHLALFNNTNKSINNMKPQWSDNNIKEFKLKIHKDIIVDIEISSIHSNVEEHKNIKKFIKKIGADKF